MGFEFRAPQWQKGVSSSTTPQTILRRELTVFPNLGKQQTGLIIEVVLGAVWIDVEKSGKRKKN